MGFSIGQSFLSAVSTLGNQATRSIQGDSNQFERSDDVHASLLPRYDAMNSSAASMNLSQVEQQSTITFKELCNWMTTGNTDSGAELSPNQQKSNDDSFPGRMEVYNKILKMSENKNAASNNEVTLPGCSNDELLEGLNELSVVVTNNDPKLRITTVKCIENNIFKALPVLKSLGANLRNGFEYSNWNSAVGLAIKSGHANILRTLHRLGVNLNENRENIVVTAMALHHRDAHADVLPTLHELGIDFSKPIDNRTPATFAVEFSHINVLRTLHELGVDLSKQDGNGLTPAMFADKYGLSHVLQTLDELGVGLHR